MKTIEEFVIELNKLINSDQNLPKKPIKPVLNSFSQLFDVKYKFIDIGEYDNELLKMIHGEDMRFQNTKKYKVAKIFRDLEEKCIECIKLKKEYNISKSEFRYEQGYLIYLCCGSTYIDCSVRDYFAEI